LRAGGVTRAATPRAAIRARAAGRRTIPADARDAVVVRSARRRDLDQVIAIDATVTGVEKRDYWQSVFRRYAGAAQDGRRFLVAEADRHVVGYVIGEVRDWEFGSPPCGWVFGIGVKPGMRLRGVGTRLLASVCADFRSAGVRKVRTLLARDNTLILSFFRSQGMMAGPFIPLEMELDA
jgi:ribosomal protein S18 acetylase RimI-like enzyme